MDWKNEYRSRLTTAEEVLSAIHDGDTIVMSECAGVPRTMVQTLAANHERFKGVKIYHMLTLGEGECLAPECYENFCHLTNFVGANSRQAVWSGSGSFFPAYFKDVPAMLGREIACDVAIITVTPPDDFGYCSVGLSCDYAVSAAHKAKVVIAEMNSLLPYTSGGTLLHVSELTHIVPVCYQPPTLAPAHIGPVEEAIGRNCASLIADGDTLQLGIGAIPDAVLAELRDKQHIGIHTEMFSDGVVDLVEAGVIDGQCKTLHKGKLVATFLMGTRKLYDFVDHNPMVELFGVDYVNDPCVIARNNNMVAINSCIEVDLQGQVASESMGTRQFSGTGGQVDYVRGAAMSKGGRSIMAMPSTAAHGKVSRIVATLAPGAAVTTSRNDVDYVVTEFGIAHLRGKTIDQRAEALIGIAHPDFREKLKDDYNQWYKNLK
ncbi:MAG: acetyl-CoA hydrolase/transferase family protein [Bacteroidales bacterium]|nr:acetyl-CoA hydrolase/transferase family protein [Bacteroidales bacterium]